MYLDSRLLGEMLERRVSSRMGGRDYGLPACYAILLKKRNQGHCYNPVKHKNGKVSTHYRLLSLETGMTVKTLKQHVPTLIEMGLAHFTDHGGFFMLGREKVRLKYNNSKGKSIPIRLGKNFTDTKSNMRAITIVANLYRQQSMIDKKVTLNKALQATKRGRPVSKQLNDLILRTHKGNRIDLENLNKVENTVLSNQRIAQLITGSESDDCHNGVSKGGYWRKRLQEKGFIFSRRRFKSIYGKVVTYDQYMQMKKYLQEEHGYITYRKGRIVKPIVSECLVTVNPVNWLYSSECTFEFYSKFQSTGFGKSFPLPNS